LFERLHTAGLEIGVDQERVMKEVVIFAVSKLIEMTFKSRQFLRYINAICEDPHLFHNTLLIDTYL
jgi:hypothetical protein